MKLIKRTLPVAAFVICTFFVVGNAAAHGDCMRKMENNPKFNISDEQKKQLRTTVQSSRDTASDIRGQIFVKRHELKALHNAAFPDANAVGKKASEISELRKALRAERKKLGESIDKILGLEPGTHDFGSCLRPHNKRGHKDGHGRGGHGMRGKGMDGHGMGGHGKGKHDMREHRIEQKPVTPEQNKKQDAPKENEQEIEEEM